MTLVNLNKTPFPWFGGKTKAAELVWLTGGMGNTGRADSHDGHQQNRERLWSSPHCLTPAAAATQDTLW